MTQALTKRNDGTEIIPIDATDAKAWELVNTVLGWMSENACHKYSKAFRELGVPHASYYHAIKRLYVEGMMP